MRPNATSIGLIIAFIAAAATYVVGIAFAKRKNTLIPNDEDNRLESQTGEREVWRPSEGTKTSSEDVSALHRFAIQSTEQQQKNFHETEIFPSLEEDEEEELTTTSLTFYNSGLLDCSGLFIHRSCSPIAEEEEVEDEDSDSVRSSSSDLIYYSKKHVNDHDDDQQMVDFDDDPDFLQLLLQENHGRTWPAPLEEAKQSSEDKQLPIRQTISTYAEEMSSNLVREAIDSCPRITDRPLKRTGHRKSRCVVTFKLKKCKINFSKFRRRSKKNVKRYAFVTCIRDCHEELNAVHLGNSLKILGSQRRTTAIDSCVLVGTHCSPTVRQLLNDVFTHVYFTSDLCSNDDLALSLLGRPDVASTFAKLHCWRLTQYQKCVYLEADTLVLRNCDDLFARDELSAVPDVGWPDCFNAGVFVFRPSLTTFAQLVSLLNATTSKYSYQGGDQGLLNAYFKDWRNDLSKRLPFVYNVFPSAHYTYGPALKHFSSTIKIVHFYKPWSAPWPSESSPPSNDQMDSWTSVFKNKVLPKFPEAAQRVVEASRTGSASQLLQILNQRPPPVSHLPQQQPTSSLDSTSHCQQPPESSSVQPSCDSHETQQKPEDEHQRYIPELWKPSEITENVSVWESHVPPTPAPSAQPLDPHWEALLWDTIKSPWEPPAPVEVQDYQPAYQRNESEQVEPPSLTFGWYSSDTGAKSAADEQPPSSVPDAFAPSPFPLPEETESRTSETEPGNEVDTSERSAERMKAWEDGNIDYLGKDKFDNIWRRLELMLRDPEVKSDVSSEEEADVGRILADLNAKAQDQEEEQEKEAEKEEKESWAGYPEGDLSGMYEWQEGRIDYTGRDKSDNILKRLNLVMSGGVVPHSYN